MARMSGREWFWKKSATEAPSTAETLIWVVWLSARLGAGLHWH